MDHIKVLTDILSIDTSVPPGRGYLEVVQYLEPLFSQAGMETQRIAIPTVYSGGEGGRVNLLAHRRNPGLPRLLLYTHIDVVPAQGWPAFEPRVSANKVYARGAADMKGAIISLLMALEKIREKPVRFDISVMVTTDEETSQADEVRYLKQFLEPLAGGYLLSLDSGFGYVAIANLGALQLDIKVNGHSVHSALSHLGQNAVEQALELTGGLLRLKEAVQARKSSLAAPPQTGLDHMEARLNINVIQGGLKSNIVPDECHFVIDRRLIPEEDISAAEEELVKILNQPPRASWEITSATRIPTYPPASGPEVDKLENSLRRVTGQSGRYGEMGSGDMAPIATREWGMEYFGTGVIRPECNIHGQDEFAYLSDIDSLSDILADYMAS